MTLQACAFVHVVDESYCDQAVGSSYLVRARMIAANGNAANGVVWGFGVGAVHGLITACLTKLIKSSMIYPNVSARDEFAVKR